MSSIEPLVPLPQCASQRVVSLGAEGCERLVSSLRDQRRLSWSPDVVVVSGQCEFPAHVCVLEATSPVLAEAARRAVRRSVGNEPSCGEARPPPARITLEMGKDNNDAEALALVLDFAYGALVTVTEANVEALLELSSKLRIGVLVDECCAFVAQRTSAARACRVLALADKHRCTLLRRDVGLCVLRHFKQACGLFPAPDEADKEALAGFLALPRHLLDEILADDRLCVDDESRVFLAAVAWLEYDENRLQDADAVLALVRYYLVSAEFLADTIEPHPLMQSRACKDLVHAAYRWQALPPTRRAEKATPVRRKSDDDHVHDTPQEGRGGESSARHRVAIPKKNINAPEAAAAHLSIDSLSCPRSSGQENPFLSIDSDDEDDDSKQDDTRYLRAADPANRQAFV